MGHFFSEAWDVLLLFLIPIGGGIPAGVVLANNHGLSWLVMCGLYFVSDVILACVFEPLMLLFLRQSERTPWLGKFRVALAQSTSHTVGKMGINPGPFT